MVETGGMLWKFAVNEPMAERDGADPPRRSGCARRCFLTTGANGVVMCCEPVMAPTNMCCSPQAQKCIWPSKPLSACGEALTAAGRIGALLRPLMEAGLRTIPSVLRQQESAPNWREPVFASAIDALIDGAAPLLYGQVSGLPLAGPLIFSKHFGSRQTQCDGG